MVYHQFPKLSSLGVSIPFLGPIWVRMPMDYHLFCPWKLPSKRGKCYQLNIIFWFELVSHPWKKSRNCWEILWLLEVKRVSHFAAPWMAAPVSGRSMARQRPATCRNGFHWWLPHVTLSEGQRGVATENHINGGFYWEHQGNTSYGYGSIPIDTFLVGWTSIYQLWLGVH